MKIEIVERSGKWSANLAVGADKLFYIAEIEPWACSATGKRYYSVNYLIEGSEPETRRATVFSSLAKAKRGIALAIAYTAIGNRESLASN